MSLMECGLCGRMADARSFRLCSGCGAPLCDDCHYRADGFCIRCGSDD